MSEAESSEMIVLVPGLQSFQRSVFDGGKRIKTLHFVAGIPVELDDAELNAVSDDLGNTLAVAQVTEDGKIRIDRDLTHEVVVAIANEKTKSGSRLTPAQKLALEVEGAKKKAAERSKEQANSSGNDSPDSPNSDPPNPFAELDERQEALESEIESLTGSIDDAETDEIKQEIRNRVSSLQADLVQLSETRSSIESLLIQEEIQAAESELETLNAVIEDEQTSEEDVKQAKKEAGNLKRKITNATKSLEKLTVSAG